MNVLRNGIILNVERFDDCLAFYRDLLGLRVLFQTQDGDFKLCCLDYGACYLMLETGGQARPEGKTVEESAAKLRFNVADLDQALAHIRAYGLEAEITRSDWGSSINLHDPDGNRVGIRDEAGFEQQLKQGSIAQGAVGKS